MMQCKGPSVGFSVPGGGAIGGAVSSPYLVYASGANTLANTTSQYDTGRIGVACAPSAGAQLDVAGVGVFRTTDTFPSAGGDSIEIGYRTTGGYGEIQGANRTGATWKNICLQRQGGNMGFGVAPSASWDAAYKFIALNGALDLYMESATNRYGGFVANAYYSGSWKYIVNGTAARVEIGLLSVGFVVYLASAGTADGAITWTGRFAVNADTRFNGMGAAGNDVLFYGTTALCARLLYASDYFEFLGPSGVVIARSAYATSLFEFHDAGGAAVVWSRALATFSGDLPGAAANVSDWFESALADSSDGYFVKIRKV
jgi:hypothetical protein